jgi:hypothetical protein
MFDIFDPSIPFVRRTSSEATNTDAMVCTGSARKHKPLYLSGLAFGAGKKGSTGQCKYFNAHAFPREGSSSRVGYSESLTLLVFLRRHF